jgi:hypothetical protein
MDNRYSKMEELMCQLIRLDNRVLENSRVTPNDHNELCEIARSIIDIGIEPNEPLLEMTPQTEFNKLFDCCMDLLSRTLQPIMD